MQTIYIKLFCQTIAFFIFSLWVSACQNNNNSSQEDTQAQNRFADAKFRQIYDLQDQRNTKELFNFLQDDKSDFRAAAAVAFASVQDTAAIPELLNLRQDISDEVREAAAYALGQIGDTSAVEGLLLSFENEEVNKVKAQLLEALGKCANDQALDFLAKQHFGEPDLQLGQGRGIYRAGLKGKTSPLSKVKMLELLQETDAAVQQIAAYYFGRIRSLDLSNDQQVIEDQFANTQNLLLKTNLALALGRLKNDQALKSLRDVYVKESNYLVKVNIIRAMGNFSLDQVQEDLQKALTNENQHIALTAESVLYNQLKAPRKIDVEIPASTDPYTMGVYVKNLSGDAAYFDKIKDYYYQADHPYFKTSALEALVQMRQGEVYQALQQNQEDIDTQFAEIFKNAIESKDIGLIYHTSLLLRDPKIKTREMFPEIDFMKSTLKALNLPKDIEAYQELQKTIDYLEGRPPRNSFEKSTDHPIDWTTIDKIAQNQRVTLMTTKGNIVIALKVNESPGTVATFVKLVQDGFYNQKTFHRIVPNFVAQGGCPRGDGFGGLDYTIRSEFAQQYYKTGSVGVASAGKDTESCQFFITHSPTPHLDGRYTIFAEVVDGMDVVHQLQMGDVIEEVVMED